MYTHVEYITPWYRFGEISSRKALLGLNDIVRMMSVQLRPKRLQQQAADQTQAWG